MNNEQIHVPGTRTVTGDGFKVELDLSSQVLAVEAPIDFTLTSNEMSNLGTLPRH